MKFYTFPNHVVDICHVVYVLDGDKLSLERFERHLNLVTDSSALTKRLEGFQQVDLDEFNQRLQIQASDESIELFSKKYDLLYGPKHFKLCYVDGDWMYFTTQALEKQWGDDWDDAPYEHNAGAPYVPSNALSRDFTDGIPNWEIKKVAFDGGLQRPCDGSPNSFYSVEQINKGAIAWLFDRWGSSGVVITAGTSLEDCIKLVEKAGGKVYQ